MMAPTTTSGKTSFTSYRKQGSPVLCPNCGADRLAESEDLVFEDVRGGIRVMVANLAGVQCDSCRATYFSSESAAVIRRNLPDEPFANYEVRITRIGGKSLGTYLPKDLVRVMELEPGDLATATVIGRHEVLLRFGPQVQAPLRESGIHSIDPSFT